MKKDIFLFPFVAAFGVFLSLATPLQADDSTDEYAEEIFPSTGVPCYRIPSIACTRKGNLIAVVDYRYGGTDIGYGSVELRRRISHDNGATWGDELEFTHGKYATSPQPKYDAAYGDPCIVADRTGDSILVMSCSGNTGFQYGTREVHQGIARFYSTDEGETWSEPEYIQESVYSLFDKSSRGPVRSLFIGSGKIHQSRYVKVGAFYRLYCSVLVKDVNNTYCNYVLYSDDFGGLWKLLGDADTPAIPSGADEPKTEELPDGSVICSSRIRGGRKFNIFTFTDAAKAEGSWGTVATSDASNNGVSAVGNSCNGEILILPSIRKADGVKLYVALQSVPFGYGKSSDGRDNVGIYYKELCDKSDFGTAADFARDWDGRHQATYLRSAYSTMCMQADGRIAFLYEETRVYDFSIIYKPYTLEDITGGLYTLDTHPQRYAFLSRFIDEEVSPFTAAMFASSGHPIP